MKLMRTNCVLSLFAILVCLLSSCKKEEGFGGLASISGKVYAYDYNSSGKLEAEGYAGDIEVYISADGDSEILERGRTSYDGGFIFRELRKGNYQVWVYSDCSKCPNGHEAVVQKVNIPGRKSHIELEVFEINI